MIEKTIRHTKEYAQSKTILTADGEPATCLSCQLQYEGFCTAKPPTMKGFPRTKIGSVCVYWRARP